MAFSKATLFFALCCLVGVSSFEIPPNLANQLKEWTEATGWDMCQLFSKYEACKDGHATFHEIVEELESKTEEEKYEICKLLPFLPWCHKSSTTSFPPQTTKTASPQAIELCKVLPTLESCRNGSATYEQILKEIEGKSQSEKFSFCDILPFLPWCPKKSTTTTRTTFSSTTTSATTTKPPAPTTRTTKKPKPKPTTKTTKKPTTNATTTSRPSTTAPGNVTSTTARPTNVTTTIPSNTTASKSTTTIPSNTTSTTTPPHTTASGDNPKKFSLMWFLIGMAVMLGIVVLVGLLWWIVKKCRTPAEGYNQLLTA